jgi:hypothetical protein
MWLRPKESFSILDTLTSVGPRVEAGTLVVVGGRIALLAKDGTLRWNVASLPAGVSQVIEVATSAGPRLFARAGAGIYRIDEVGAPVPLAQVEGGEYGLRIGSGPGLVAFWSGSALERPLDSGASTATGVRFLDPESGDEVDTPAPFVQQPVSALAFKSRTEGAAVLRATGLAVTSDGGATWRPIARAGLLDDADPTELALERGTVVEPGAGGDILTALGGTVPGARPIDIAAASIGPATPSPGGGPMLQWIRMTETDPRVEAARSGVPFPSGDVLALHLRTIARVVPATGLVTDVATLPAGGCTMAGTPDTAWIRCYGDMSVEEQKLYRVPLRDGPLTVEPDVVLEHFEGSVIPVTSPSGGVMLGGGCTRDDKADACVRQPDGSWKSIRVEAGKDDPWRRLAGPLADGRLAYGRSSGDASSGQVAVVARDAAGREEVLATFSTASLDKGAAPTSPLRELRDRSLAALVASGGGIASLLVTAKRAATLTPVAKDVRGGLAGEHGVLFASDGKTVRVTEDGGATWSEEAIPAALGIASGFPDVVVTDAGAYDGNLKAGFLGWSFPAALAQPDGPTVEGGGTAIGPPSDARELGALVRCTLPPEARAKNRERTTGTQPRKLTQGRPQRNYLGPPFPPPAASADPKRILWGFPQWPQEPQAALDQAGPPEAPRATLRWFDPDEMGGAVHAWSGKLDAIGMQEGALTMMARGGAVVVEAGKQVASAGGLLGKKRVTSMIRVAPDGRAWTAAVPGEIAPEKTPPETFAIGRTDDAPVAWNLGSVIAVWRPGEAPRALASIAARADVLVGEPTRDAVPLLVIWGDRASFRWLPILSAGKTYGRDAWLTGWQDVPDPRGTRAFPVCPKSVPDGARFRLWVQLELGGDLSAGGTQLVELLVTPGHACLAGFLHIESGQDDLIVRADLVAGRAERVHAYRAGQRLTCTVGKP